MTSDDADAVEPPDAETGTAVASPPEGLASRLRRLLGHRFWSVDAELGARQRLRLLVGIPFAAIAGLAWGAFAAPSLVGGPLLWPLVGAASFSMFMYVQQRLIGPIGRVVGQLWPRLGGVAGLVWEVVAVGGIFFLLTSVLGAPLVPAVGTALGLGAFYVVLTEFMMFGAGGSGVALLLHGGSAASGSRREGFSYAESLVARGRTAEAIEIYLDAIARRPRSLEPYLRLSALRVREREYEEALRVLREARRIARLSAEEEAVVARRVHSICSRHLGRAALARPELEWLIERQRRSEHATWARWRLREIDEQHDDPETEWSSAP